MECLRSLSLQASSFSIPAAACRLDTTLFPLRLHPLHATLQEHLYEWGKAQFGQVLSENEIEKIRHANYGWLASSFWSQSSSPTRSLTLLKLMFWFIVFDDAIDNSASLSRNANAAHSYCCFLLQKLFGNASGCGKQLLETGKLISPSSNDLERSYSERELLPVNLALEWWGEMTRDGAMPIKQQARFITAIEDYVMSQVSIVRFNELMDAGAPPAVHEFVPVRRVAIGAPLCFLATEYDLGITLDEEILGDPCLQRLQDAVSDHVAWINDILSLNKELARGDFLSLPCLLHSQNNTEGNCSIPFEAATSQAWEMTLARQQECAQLAMEIMRLPHLSSSACLQKYVDGVCSISTGNWAWSINCSRYRTTSALS